MKNRRKYPRVNVNVLASYNCYNNDGEIFEHGIGVILDVSCGGLLIESNSIIDANFLDVVFINYDNRDMKIVASVVYSRKIENGKTRTGLCFHGTKSNNIKFVTNLIRTYHYSKKINPQKNISPNISSIHNITNKNKT
jgi:hypothetical protein